MTLSRTFPLVLTCFVLACLAPTSLHAQDTEPEHIELPDELDRVLRDYEEGWQNRDASALAALFTLDGFILRPGHPPVRGRDNIEAAYSSSGGPLALYAYDYATEDSTGYIIGGYSGAVGSPSSGKYILTLQLAADGRWMITADMDNGNRR